MTIIELHNYYNHPIIIINESVSSFIPIRNMTLTSLVTSTIQNGTTTIIHLDNGIELQTTENIKSGDMITLNSIYYKPFCSIVLTTKNNTKILNDTIVLIESHKNPECESNTEFFKIIDWYRINQK